MHLFLSIVNSLRAGTSLFFFKAYCVTSSLTGSHLQQMFYQTVWMKMWSRDSRSSVQNSFPSFVVILLFILANHKEKKMKKWSHGLLINGLKSFTWCKDYSGTTLLSKHIILNLFLCKKHLIRITLLEPVKYFLSCSLNNEVL